MTVEISDSDHKLGAGKPERIRIVGIDNAENTKTKFGLMALVLPKGGESK
jgi:hypothetical protein